MRQNARQDSHCKVGSLGKWEKTFSIIDQTNKTMKIRRALG